MLSSSLSNKYEFTILASAVRNGNVNSADFYSGDYPIVQVILNITAVPGVITLDAALQGYDVLSAAYFDIILLLTPPLATGIYVLDNATASAVTYGAPYVALPKIFRVQMRPSGAGNFTYSVGGVLSNRA